MAAVIIVSGGKSDDDAARDAVDQAHAERKARLADDRRDTRNVFGPGPDPGIIDGTMSLGRSLYRELSGGHEEDRGIEERRDRRLRARDGRANVKMLDKPNMTDRKYQRYMR